MRKLGLLLLLFVLGFQSRATHISGADFNYTCIGQDSFYITLNLFRDCSGIASPNNANVTFTSTCGQSFSVQLTKQNGQFGEEISQLCPGDISNSTCNGGPLIGMQHYIYGGVVVLSPPCDTWTMQWSLCCRNTTVNLVGQPEMLVEATLNSATDSCNNSPVFNAQPILYVCLNQNVNYNFGISEADGDSLVYQFVTPKDEIVGGNVQPVPFSPGYSYTQPIAGISLSTTTGQLQFTPTIAGNFVLAVEVCEYDYATGLLQGCVIRDIQFIVIPCANQAPTPPVNGISSFTGTGMQVSNDSVLICEGNSFSFDIVFTDADTGDSVTLTTNLATVLPGASFSFSHGNPATMTVSGIATAAMANYNAFYVHAVDDACPISAFGTHSYFILTQPKPTVFAGGNSIMCHDQASVPISGSIQDAGGGIWSGNGTFGQATTNLNNEYYPTTAEIAAGSASVVLTSTGNQNCDPVSDTLVIQITQFNEPFTPGYSPVKCSSGTDGKAFISHTFSSPISITWNTNPVQYGDSALNLTSGSYTATLVDSNGCDTSVVIVVPEPTEIATSITFLSHVFCTGGNDGQATINAIGGVSPYTYNWPASANNQTTATGSNLFAGVYVVTITDSNLCYTTETVTILEPNFPLNLVVSTTDVSCFGGNDGSAEAFPTGGTAPYSYTWGPNNQTTNPITNVSSGTYSVTVVDNSGMCVVQTGIIIDEPDPIGGSNTSLNVLCDGGNTGVLGFVPSGGTMPFSYQWGGAAGGATSSTVANMGAGAYPLSLIDSLGCRFDTIVNLLAPTILTATGNSTTTLCKDASNGTASVTPSGGVSPYVVSWNDINSQTGLTAVNLLAGSYIATIIDSNGCDTSVTVVVSEPDSLTGTIVSQSNVNCTGGVDGVVQVSGLGGTSPYSYLWDTNANNQTTAVADSLSAGSYDVTITDANGCSYVLNVVITEPFYPLVLSVTATNISCYGAANGTVSVSAAGGTNPYQYSWSPSGQTTSTITNLDESTNTVTVTDNSGQCIVQSGISITQPDTLSTVAVITDVLCNSGNTGEAQISTKGGTKPYSITWNAAAGGQTDSLATNLTAGTFAFTITDSNNCQYDSTVTLTQPSALSMSSLDSIPKCFNGADGNIQVFGYGGNAPYSFTWDANASNQTDSIAIGLSTGFYTVTLTDSNSCTLDSTFFLNQPTPVSTSSITLEHIGCFGDSTGTATIIATGGASPYEYVWNTSSNLENSGGVFGLWADTYFLTITDSNGCVFDTNIIINQPAFPLGVDSIISDVACFGDSTGFIESIATGGTAPYVYLWDSAANNQTSAIATNLAIGSYQVWVVDSNGCQDSLMATINQPVQALGVSVLESNVLCFGESNGYAVANSFGGTAPYSYQWGSGTVNQVGDSATNLPQGSYSVTISDTLGCMVDTAIIINEPQPLTINSSSLVDVDCFGDSTGQVQVNVLGGTLPYTFSWSATANNQTDSIANNLGAGNYTVSVLDSNGCMLDSVFTISQPANALNIQATQSAVNCKNGSDGSITATIVGGTNPYSVQWGANTGFQTGLNLNGLTADSYQAVVTDNKGCLDTVQVSITEPSFALSNSSVASNVSCFGFSDGSSNLLVMGGTSPYNVVWDANTGNQTGITASNLVAGNYQAFISDANGCLDTHLVSITQPQPITIMGQPDDTVCTQANFNLDVQVSGGNGGYDYTWNNGLGNASYHVTTTTNSNTYIVSVTDKFGCPGASDTINITVNNIEQDSLTVWHDGDVCAGESTNLFANYNSLSGTYSFQWNNGLGSGTGPISVSPNQSTIYQVTVTDECNISITDFVVVNVLQAPVVSLQEILGQGCGPLTVNFEDQVTDSGSFTYLWNLGDGTTSSLENPSNTYSSPGTYYISVVKTGANGCPVTLSSPSMVIVNPTPLADGVPDKYVTDITQPTINYSDQSMGATAILWTFSPTDFSTDLFTSYTYPDTGVYPVHLKAENQYGCESDHDFEIKVVNSNKIEVPTAFIPNSNGGNGGTYDATSLSNEVFYARLESVTNFEMLIFNRWGELIFESNDVNIGWDGYYRGKLSAQDVYVWKINVVFEDGSQVSEVGNLTLIQ